MSTPKNAHRAPKNAQKRPRQSFSKIGCRVRPAKANMTTALSLTIEQRAELQRCERVIQSGLETFELVGNALLSVRDSKLYRETHDDFEHYCRDKWSMSKRHANRMVGAAEAVANLGPVGPRPTAERQVRPLTELQPEQQREAWTAAVEASDGKPTAKHVEAAVEEIKARDAEPIKTSAPPIIPPSRGLTIAEGVIDALKKIKPNDTERKAAAVLLINWIKKNLQ